VPSALYRNTPATVDLDLYAGDTVAMLVTVEEAGEPWDLTGTNEAVIRSTVQDEIVEDLTVTIDVTDAGAGQATVSVTGTEAYLFGFQGVWDWQHTGDDDTVRTVCRGKVTITADVTRPA
jgi:hypothetical protein